MVMNRILVSIFLLTSVVARAQEATTPPESPKTVFGIKGGVNISTFSASINSESRAKPGLALGLYVKTAIGRRSFFRPELYYSNQGQKDNYLYPYGGPSIGTTTTNMHYVNIPLLFEIGKKVSFQFGPQVGFLVKGKETGTIASVQVDEDLKDVMSAIDFSLVVGLGVSLGDHFNSGVRYNHGVTNIYSPDDDSFPGVDPPTVQNRVFHFYIAYSF
jgi:hypothetical protein